MNNRFSKFFAFLCAFFFLASLALYETCSAEEFQWSADFKGGAAADLHLRDDGWIGFTIPAEPGDGEYLWFYFNVFSDGVDAPGFLLENAAGAHQTGKRWSITRPVFSADGHSWVRAVETDYARDTGLSNLLSEKVFRFRSPIAAETLRVAYCYPYTHDNLMAFLRTIDHSNVSISSLGCSEEARDIVRIDIAARGTAAPVAKQIWIVCREHPGETPASFVCEGMINALLNQPYGKLLRERFSFTIIPMLNVDGVARGYYYHNTNGVNLARDWVDFKSTEVQSLRDAFAEEVYHSAVQLVINLHSSNDPSKGHFFLKMPEGRLHSEDADFQPKFFQAADGSHPQIQGKSTVTLLDLPSITGNALYRNYGVYCLYFESNYNRGADGSLVTIEFLRNVGEALVRSLSEVLLSE